MNLNYSYRKPLIGLVSAVSVFVLNMPFAHASGWTFQVTNSGSTPLLKVEASEDGETWGEFKGSSIDPGETATMEWAPATDDSNCVWQVRGVYADGSSEAAEFDFCSEPDLEFTN